MACGAMATYKHMHGNLLGDTKARILLHPSPILRKPDTYGDSPFRLGFLSGFYWRNVWIYRTCLRTLLPHFCSSLFTVVHIDPVSLKITSMHCSLNYDGLPYPYLTSLHGPAPRNKLKVIILLNVWIFTFCIVATLKWLTTMSSIAFFYSVSSIA